MDHEDLTLIINLRNDEKNSSIRSQPGPFKVFQFCMHFIGSGRHRIYSRWDKKGEILGKPILDLKTKPRIEDVHTVTIYLNPANQKEWYNYILSLNPKRLIFNPGTENIELGSMAEKQGIEVEYACNLVLLRTGQF